MITELLQSITEVPFFEGVPELTLRFLINLFFAWIMIDRIYFRLNKQRELLFTLFAVNILIFFVASILADVKVKTGFGFGLFAIFSILRYRTETLGIKEMTFLFAGTILAVINSMVTVKLAMGQIFLANIAIVTMMYLLEKRWLRLRDSIKMVTYDRIELVDAGREMELIQDLAVRTGLAIRSIEILKIDLLKDTAEIAVYYDENAEG